MATNLKHSTGGLIEAFEQHLVYEVSMLRHTFNFLLVNAWSTELRNAIIESFCVHARNIVDFFDEKSSSPGQAKSDYVGAKHFCNPDYEPWTKGRPSNDLYGRLNRQVSHLTFDRTSKNEEKLGGKELGELFRLIEQELQIFGKYLRDPYAGKWPFGDNDKVAVKATASVTNLSATNHTTSVSNSYDGGPTGPAGPNRP